MVSMIWNRIGAWMFPWLDEQRKWACDQVTRLGEELNRSTDLVAQLTIENRKLKTLVDAMQKPETPKMLRPATPAEVRRITEQAFAMQEES